jgi:hypothetical protein
MTLAELVQEVYNLTNRPDLVSQTASAIKAATLKVHATDFYSKDIYETGIQFEEAKYVQAVDAYELLSNFRAIKYIRIAENATDDTGNFIDVLNPEETIDAYGRNRTNVCYLAGRIINIRTSVPLKYALVGCYVRPIITEANYASWVAQMHPYAIVYEAARSIFKLVGYDEESAAYDKLVAEEYRALRISNLTDVGY